MSQSAISFPALPEQTTRFSIRVTGSQIDLDDIETHGETIESTGWVDYSWNPEMLHESSSDVEPFGLTSRSEIDIDDPDLDTWPKVVLDTWLDVLRRIGDVTQESSWYSVDQTYSTPTSSRETQHNLHPVLVDHDGRETPLTNLPTTAEKAKDMRDEL